MKVKDLIVLIEADGGEKLEFDAHEIIK